MEIFQNLDKKYIEIKNKIENRKPSSIFRKSRMRNN